MPPIEPKQVTRKNSPHSTRPAPASSLNSGPTLLTSMETFTRSMARQAERPYDKMWEAFQALPVRECSERQAQHLFQFLNLVEFKNESKLKEFRVAIVGNPKVKDAFREIEGRLVRGKPVKLAVIKKPDDLKNVSLLYVDQKHPARAKLMEEAGTREILSIEGGPSRRLSPETCMGLIPTRDKPRFMINVDAVRRNHITISPYLVRSAMKLTTHRGLQSP